MKNRLFLFPALLCFFSGCVSVDPSTVSPVPVIDYSKIAPDESAILAYLDPSLVRVYKDSASAIFHLGGYEGFSLVIDGRDAGSIQLWNTKYLTGSIRLNYKQSVQIGVINGTHTVQLKAFHQVGVMTTPRPQMMPPFQIAMDNIAVTYKVRLATAEEKNSAGFRAVDILYTLEEMSVQPLR